MDGDVRPTKVIQCAAETVVMDLLGQGIELFRLFRQKGFPQLKLDQVWLDMMKLADILTVVNEGL